MKLKLILSAVLAAGVLAAQAATENTAAVPAAVTNGNPEAAMTALFGDPVIAKGTGFEIKQSALDEVLSGAKANAAAAGRPLPQNFGLGVLNQLITIQMLLQKATPADRVAGQADADLQFTNLVKHFGSLEAFQRQLTAVGMTVADLRRKATQEATAKAALKRELNVSVTEAEERAFYTNHHAEFEVPEKVQVRHILLMTIDPATHQPLSTNTIAAKKKEIEDLLKRAKGGEDFATLAEKYSEDPGSKANGGELPEFSRGEMVPEFEAAAFALAPGQISDVVKTVYGYHIIKMIDKVPAKEVAFSEAEPDIKDYLIRQKIAKLAPAFIKKLRAEDKVEILDPTLKAQEEQLEAAETAALNDSTNTAPTAMDQQ